VSEEETGLECPPAGHVQRFLDTLSDPVHKRLIEAHGGDDPVRSMESELANILKEVLNRED